MSNVYITSSWAVVHHSGKLQHTSFICPICGQDCPFDEHGHAECPQDRIYITVPPDAISKLFGEVASV